jgi:hypothetical protein
VRIAELSPPARDGFAALRERRPQYVDRLLQGSGAAGFPRPHVSDIGPLDLDLLWAEFFATGDTAPVLRIISVLDGKDLVRERLDQWLRDNSGFWGRRRIAKFRPLLIRCVFPVDYENCRMEEGVDLDLPVALNAKNPQLRFDELPIKLSIPECIRLAVKSAAVWSLRSIAEKHERVAEICAVEAKRPGGMARQLLAPKLR